MSNIPREFQTDQIAHTLENTPLRTVPEEIAALKKEIAKLRRELQPYKEWEANQDTAEARAEARAERKAERQRKIEESAAAELMKARAEAIRAIARLLPEAVKQAKGAEARAGRPAQPPRPALLRMILRATR